MKRRTVGCSQAGPGLTGETDKPGTPDKGSSTQTSAIVWGDWMLSEDAYAPIYQAMVDSFTDAYPDIKVETYFQPYSQYLDQLLIAAAAGNAPDIVHIKSEWMPQFMALDAVKEVTSVVSKELLDDYNKAAIDAITYDGKLMGLPWFTNAYAMFYNKNLLDKAGITELPKNLDELIDAAYKISALGTDEKGNKIYGVALANSNTEVGEGYNTFPLLWGYGGDFLDSNGKVCLTNEPALKAFTNIQKLYVDGVSPVGASFKDARNLFGQGVIGFFWDAEAGIGASAAAAPDKDKFYESVGAMVIPSKDGPNGHGYLSDRFMIVFKNCADEKMENIGKFMEHMSGPDCIRILYEANQGKMSSRKSVMEKVYGNVESPITRAFVEAIKTAKPLPSGNLHFMDADKLITDGLARLAQGEDVKAVMTDIESQIQALYNE